MINLIAVISESVFSNPEKYIPKIRDIGYQKYYEKNFLHFILNGRIFYVEKSDVLLEEDGIVRVESSESFLNNFDSTKFFRR